MPHSIDGEERADEGLAVVSLGTSCQTPRQLALYGQARADVTFVKNIYDWIAAPPDVAADWLDADLEGFELEDLAVRRGHAWLKPRNLYAWHWFGKTQPVGPKKLNIPLTIEREKAKFAHQTSIFRTLDPARTLFVTANTQNNLEGDVYSPPEFHRIPFNAADIDRLNRSLDAFFGARCRMLTISYESRSDAALRERARESDLVAMLDVDDTEWEGDDDGWAAAIDRAIAPMRERHAHTPADLRERASDSGAMVNAS